MPAAARKVLGGIYTTEFWLTVLTVLCATALTVTGHLDADNWMLVATGATGAYAVSRGLAKKS